jgi:hypothetical protein
LRGICQEYFSALRSVPKAEYSVSYMIYERKGDENFTMIYPCNGAWGPIGLWNVESPTYFLDNQFTDGGKFFSLKRLTTFNPQEDFRYSFLLEAESMSTALFSWKIR